MTADQLRKCREAFMEWFRTTSPQTLDFTLQSTIREFAYQAWKDATIKANTRPTAVASHAEGEVVAIVGEAADTWKIAAYGNENTGWIPPGDKIKTAFFLKDVPIGTSLYSHPPRSGDEAISVDYRAACCGRKECGGECGNEWRGNEPYIPESSLCALLPDSYYMDPPDGGDVNVYEQLHRMAKDAARYRWLRDDQTGAVEEAILIDRYGDVEVKLGDVLDQAIDAAMAARGEEKETGR